MPHDPTCSLLSGTDGCDCSLSKTECLECSIIGQKNCPEHGAPAPQTEAVDGAPFPFECDNCGHKATPQEVISQHGDCIKCGDTVIAFAVDSAECFLRLTQRIAVLGNENERLRANPQVGTCGVCGGAIWDKQERMADERGEFHPICRVIQRAEAAEARVKELESKLDKSSCK